MPIYQPCDEKSPSDPEEVLYIFMKRLEIKDVCPGFWLAEIFLTCYAVWLHVKSPNLTEMFLCVLKIDSFQSYLVSKMATRTLIG